MKTKTDYKSILIEINILTIAIAIIAVAVYFFLFRVIRRLAVYQVWVLFCRILFRCHYQRLR